MKALPSFFAGIALASCLIVWSCNSGTKTIAKSNTAIGESASNTTEQATQTTVAAKEAKVATNVIQTEAIKTKADLEDAMATKEVGPNAAPFVAKASERQNTILKQTDTIDARMDKLIAFQEAILENQRIIHEQVKTSTVALTTVQDTTPAWLSGLRSAAWIIAPIAVIVLLWQTGIGLVIKKAFWSVGLFIPEAAKTQAKFDAEALELSKPSANRKEAIAAQRGVNPAYDVALTREKKKIRLSTKPNAQNNPVPIP